MTFTNAKFVTASGTITVGASNFYLFHVRPVVNGLEKPAARMRLTSAEAEYDSLHAWAKLAELLEWCSQHPGFDAKCESLGLKLEIGDE